MGFLRRLLGSAPAEPAGERTEADEPAGDSSADDDERARELELARFDQERVSDLVRRQQQYADRSWTPPAQGGERRADDGDDASA
jgi:hypothetical protein